tara:strand:+ start:1134 stop:1364 length:231 start_codon:yes stop_codon:yes gene_type:complete
MSGEKIHLLTGEGIYDKLPVAFNTSVKEIPRKITPFCDTNTPSQVSEDWPDYISQPDDASGLGHETVALQKQVSST